MKSLLGLGLMFVLTCTAALAADAGKSSGTDCAAMGTPVGAGIQFITKDAAHSCFSYTRPLEAKFLIVRGCGGGSAGTAGDADSVLSGNGGNGSDIRTVLLGPFQDDSATNLVVSVGHGGSAKHGDGEPTTLFVVEGNGSRKRMALFPGAKAPPTTSATTHAKPGLPEASDTGDAGQPGKAVRTCDQNFLNPGGAAGGAGLEGGGNGGVADAGRDGAVGGLCGGGGGGSSGRPHGGGDCVDGFPGGHGGDGGAGTLTLIPLRADDTATQQAVTDLLRSAQDVRQSIKHK